MGDISDKKEQINLFMKQNWAFLPFLLFLLVLMSLYPQKILHFQEFVDWKTIINLMGLLVVVTAIKESAFIGKYSKKFLIRTRTERGLAFALVIMAGGLSMFLTNDIALFITVPLTLGFADVMKNDVKKLIIFQAMAVNAGSALTPVGNPQNLFLWHSWHISFFRFIVAMFPLFAVMFLVLFLFLWFSFSHKALTFHSPPVKRVVDSRLFALSVFLLILTIFSIEMGWVKILLPFIILFYAVFYRKVIWHTDWALLLLFVIMFIDFHLLSLVPFVQNITAFFHLQEASGAYAGGLLFSQVMSNVPAAIFLSKFSQQWQAIAYGVNVGGNGLVIASLANFIALRFVQRRSVWIDFHKYSILYLMVTAVVAYFLFFM